MINSPALPVLLIGPVNVGKSTIGPLLAHRLAVDGFSLDTMCWDYYREQGFDPVVARQHFDRGGYEAEGAYVRQYYPLAIERAIAEHRDYVIDLGAGDTVYDERDLLERVQRTLAPHPNVVLLLPSPDLDESVEILMQRHSNPRPVAVARNEYFVRHRSNHELAKITVYTKGRTPDETCEDIVTRLT